MASYSVHVKGPSTPAPQTIYASMCPVDENAEEEGSVMLLHLTIIGVSAITTAYKIAVTLAEVLRWRMITKCMYYVYCLVTYNIRMHALSLVCHSVDLC